MTLSLVRYDAARRALAAAHRVDEVKSIRDKAEAVRVYAKQAGDFELQNQAAEIRIRAERRAGELLVDMQTSGQRQAKERGRPKKVSSPTTLPKLGITRDQSSKWQRLAKMIDDATFDKALAQAKEKNSELTTAALLREIKEIVKPSGTVAEPDINVIAAELVRDFGSPARKEKLEEVIRLRNRLNPTIRKSLINALGNAAKDATAFECTLRADFQEFPSNGKAHQRVIRERMAEQPDLLLAEKKALASDFEHATVREISFEEAKNVVLAAEWLGTMGTTEFSFGLFFGNHLAGVASFGRTSGTHVASSICGPEHAHRVISLVRGACLHWSHPHSGSFLVSAACRQMTKKGYNVIAAYGDPAAGEEGVILRACNFLYCGMTSGTEQFRTPDGKVHDARQVHCLTRDRRGGTMKYRRSRAEQKRILLAQGCEFFEGTRKHRFIGIFGDRRIKRVLRNALRWQVVPFPKRAPSPENNVQVLDLGPAPESVASPA